MTTLAVEMPLWMTWMSSPLDVLVSRLPSIVVVDPPVLLLLTMKIPPEPDLLVSLRMFAPFAVAILPAPKMTTSPPAPIDLLIVTFLVTSIKRSRSFCTPPAEFSLWLIVLLTVTFSPKMVTQSVVVMLDGSVPGVNASMKTSPWVPLGCALPSELICRNGSTLLIE
jgi:hypothetical protein